MPDPEIPVETVAAPAVENTSAAAPAVSETVATEAPSPGHSAAVVETVATEAPVAEAKSLLGAAIAEAEKPPEKKPEAKPEEKPAAAVIAEPEAKAAPVYTGFKMPEGVKLADEDLGRYTGILGKHGVTQEAGQDLIDMHIAELTKATQAIEKRQLDVFQSTREGWKQQYREDPEIGGNRQATSMKNAVDVVNQIFNGRAEQRGEFLKMLDWSGLGDHPEMIRALNLVHQIVKAQKPQIVSPPVAAPVPQQQGRAATRYRKTIGDMGRQ